MFQCEKLNGLYINELNDLHVVGTLLAKQFIEAGLAVSTVEQSGQGSGFLTLTFNGGI